MNSLRGWLFSGCLAAALGACPRAAPEPKVSTGTPRSFMMGFSVIPPRPDLNIAVRSLEIWTRRADAAIMHLDVPWALLLAGTSSEEALRRDGVDLEHYYRSKHLALVVTIDVTNGLGRESEAPALVAAHRSITEPAAQWLYRNYVRALVDMLHPNYLGLAAETYLIRAIAPRPVYDARQSQLLDSAKAIGVFQLSFADLDLGSFTKPIPAILPLFATLGLVDSNLKFKPALSTWDKVLARPLRR